MKIFLGLIFFNALVRADFVIEGEEKSLLELKFGNEEKFDKKLKRVFEKIDKDNSGTINATDIDNVMSKMFKDKLNSTLPADIVSASDKDGDGALTFDELRESLTKNLNKTVIVNSPFCKRVEKVLDPCTRESGFNTRDLAAKVDEDDAELIVDACEDGIGSLFNFETEKCIVGVSINPLYVPGMPNSCMAVKRCVNDFFNRSPREVKLNDLQFANQNFLAWKTLMWVGFTSGLLVVFLATLLPSAVITLAGVWLVMFTLQILGSVGMVKWAIAKEKLVPSYNDLVMHYVNSLSDKRPRETQLL